MTGFNDDTHASIVTNIVGMGGEAGVVNGDTSFDLFLTARYSIWSLQGVNGHDRYLRVLSSYVEIREMSSPTDIQSQTSGYRRSMARCILYVGISHRWLELCT